MENEQKQQLDIFEKEFQQFINNNKQKFTKEEDLKLLQQAFAFSRKAHANMTRNSGQAYISHPLAVMKIVVEELGLGLKSAIASLLHDVPEKTEYNINDIEQYFGKKIASLVQALQKIKNTEYFENNTQASVFRQILLSVSDDIRVIFIKMADKLHNIRTISHVPVKMQRKAIEEILSIYAPLSHRLGLYNIKTEMEDLCMRYSNPKIYKKIQEKLNISEAGRNNLIEKFIEPIKKELDAKKIEYRIKSRSKSIYSIWKKMQRKKIPYEEVFDLFAIRIIYKSYDEEDERLKALNISSIITNLYSEKKDRTRNWLDEVKDTGYRAIHHTVMSKSGKWIEVQIRSESMNEAAEYGLAAHWKYKGLKEKKTEFDERVKEILEYLNENESSATDFLDNIKLNLLTSEIYVFTPQGHVINLPKGASVLDFAFKIHTDVALKSIAAKINGQIVKLSEKLKNGDQIEIITAQKQEPKKDWFNYVITHKALTELKKAFREEIKINTDKGKEIIEGIFKTTNVYNINEAHKSLSRKLGFDKINNLYLKVGEGTISESIIKQTIAQCCPGRKTRFWKIKTPFVKDSSQSSKNIFYETAKCCNPLPGDEIIGIKDEKKLLIHKKNCSFAKAKIDFDITKLVSLEWTSYTAISVICEFKISGKATKGIINKISTILSNDLLLNIKKFNFRTENKQFIIDLVLYLKEENLAETVEKKLKQLKEVDSVEKIIN